MRRLHRRYRRTGRQILHGSRRDGGRGVDHDHRRSGTGRRRTASDSGRVPRAPRIAMRLLHGGDDHERPPVAQAKSASDGERNPSQPHRQHLPLHRLYQYRARSCSAGVGGTAMTEATAIKYVGQPLRRHEDFKFVTGKGRYTDDMKAPGMLHMAVLRSPHAHAIIKQVDLSAAKAAPGVRLALSGADLAGKIGAIVPNWIMPGTKVPDRPVVAFDRVRFVGECVALVVAETQAMAHDAIGLIDVGYEILPAVVDEEAAIREGAPQLHDNVPNNITTIYKVGGGDYRKAVQEADQVISLRVANNRLIPTCRETRSILAEPNVDGSLTVYLQSQVPHMHR